MHSIIVRARFTASHSVRLGRGPRETPHGHDWLVEAEVGASDLDVDGLVVDLRVVERALKNCLASYERRLLDDLPDFAQKNPTVENVARAIFEKLEAGLARSPGTVLRVTLWERDTWGATYRPD